MYNYYLIGSVVVGLILVYDGIQILMNGGQIPSDPKGRPIGIFAVFMRVEAAWVGASIAMLLMARSFLVVPAFHLSITLVSLITGFIYFRGGSNKELKIPQAMNYVGLSFSVLFLVLSCIVLWKPCLFI